MSTEAKRSWTGAAACGNLRAVRVTGLNHVSISSIDVEASVRFCVGDFEGAYLGDSS